MFKFNFKRFLPPSKPQENAFQLKFSGLRVKDGGVENLKKFFIAVLRYVFGKVRLLGANFFIFLKFCLTSFQGVKNFIIRKLIWSRGRLGRPIANLAILFVAFILFLTGGVFSSTGFVTSATISPDYLVNVDDIIPETTVATTSLPEGRRSEAIIHEVSGGENLSSIGALYKVSTDALEYVNNISDSDFLKVGQKLVIPPVQGVIYKVKSGDTCDSIGKKFDVPSQAVLDFNYLDSCTNLQVGKELVVPDAKIPEPVIILPTVPGGVTYQRFVDTNPRSGWCQWPTSVRIISQYFTYYHDGLDIATPWGSWPPIYACAGGTVTRAGWDPWGLGLHVAIDHGNGYQTVYGHLSRLNVSVGKDVDKGDVVGIMGNTGRSTGPHVHFTIKYKGTPQNPLNYIR
ncbi:hypothetical protein A2716_01610 [candidate division WWE3 bacterium RIFCSPHIGHO2_01_FULL_40_23]|uniref:LysM domain-containing protein n=1 Tax=candidate division WWE3 bacterium RIFCSPLOWO2_01_FULL_41_18 TaxID=1802625 RepID=A0A1F4VFH1_UNCKA|nr:MAG: hypothetical protein A2716_01610 [candidate division WWE3 bacterium RIFCSPHIGHO2_01_FULL_40_23]OGC55690.1 MAG: hypothetical protein A3A78_01460 [candidate division WWE3 bacterium RIFCSPLOWO2_01_FULL_41_18]